MDGAETTDSVMEVNEMFENKVINGIHATRYIASWWRAGGQFCYQDDYWRFEDWLRSIGLQNDDVRFISNLAQNGKMELQMNAKHFLLNNQ